MLGRVLTLGYQDLRWSSEVLVKVVKRESQSSTEGKQESEVGRNNGVQKRRKRVYGIAIPYEVSCAYVFARGVEVGSWREASRVSEFLERIVVNRRECGARWRLLIVETDRYQYAVQTGKKRYLLV